MPDFADPFKGKIPDRKLTFGELTRAIRLSLSAEEEAIHLYEAMAEATDNALAAEVLRDIANEEKVHVGEFQRLLNLLLPDEAGFLADGAAEVDAMNANTTKEAVTSSGNENVSDVPTIGSLRST